jgi:predicted DNA-binding WGR domain protein
MERQHYGLHAVQDFTGMNRSTLTDSKLWLDTTCRARDSCPMIAQPYQLYVERRDPVRNMARFYALSIEPTLFGEVCLTRRWGRMGARGQAKCHTFEREEEAVQLFLGLLRSKRKRGYHAISRDAANRASAPVFRVPDEAARKLASNNGIEMASPNSRATA